MTATSAAHTHQRSDRWRNAARGDAHQRRAAVREVVAALAENEGDSFQADDICAINKLMKACSLDDRIQLCVAVLDQIIPLAHQPCRDLIDQCRTLLMTSQEETVWAAGLRLDKGVWANEAADRRDRRLLCQSSPKQRQRASKGEGKGSNREERALSGEPNSPLA